jgi:hypothetical protein
MWLDLGPQALRSRVPRPVQIVGKNGKPVDLSLKTLEVHVLHVVVLYGDNDTETEIVTESLSHLLEELNLVGAVLRAATTVWMARPLPVDINATKLPLRQKLLKGVDESLAVFGGARHFGERPLSWTSVCELETTKTQPLRETTWQSQKLLIDFLVWSVHHSDFERLWVDRGEGEHEVSDAG